jgi:hypothetical protein
MLNLGVEINRMDVVEKQRNRKVKYIKKREVEVRGNVVWAK